MPSTFNPCCDLHFTCVDCPIITGPDCQPPNNLFPGQFWYNPCTCTYYFKCGNGFDETNTCEDLTPLNYKEGAGISLVGDCENGHFISVKITPDTGLSFTVDGNLQIDCDDLINHCQLFTRNNLVPADGHFYLECELDEVGNEICTFYIDTIIQARNAGEVSSGGICVSLSIVTYDDGLLVYRGRDSTVIKGSGTLNTALGHYVTETFTNPWADAAYIEVDMIVQPTALIIMPFGVFSFEGNITYVHSITEELNVTWPTTGVGNSPVTPNWCFTPIEPNAPFYSGMPGTEGTYGSYTPHTNSCKYSKLLAPGESVTLFYQWWAVMAEGGNPVGVESFIFHGGMSTASKLIRHADHF